MRMRKLGKGQSVVFCVPDEIRKKMQIDTGAPDYTVSNDDILLWCFNETFSEIDDSIALWSEQGRRFMCQEEVRREIDLSKGSGMSQEQARRFLEAEAQSLETRYRASAATCDVDSAMVVESCGKIARIEEHCAKFENLSLRRSKLQEEQERELSPEIQQERQVQRPPPAQPAIHCLHQDVMDFVTRGLVTTTSDAYTPAFRTLMDTRLSKKFAEIDCIGGHSLLATADFARTVRSSGDKDAYQRNVQWILTRVPESSNKVVCAMIISPYEAQELFPAIQQSSKVILHSYQPRWNRIYRSLDRLDLFTVPEQRAEAEIPLTMIALLNTFAGSLYYTCFQDSLAVCDVFGLAAGKTQAGDVIGADGFMYRDSQGVVGGNSGFHSSPVPFLKELTEVRRDGNSIGNTHAGCLFEGTLLTETDFAEGKE